MTALEEAIKALPKRPKITLDKFPAKPSAKNIAVAAATAMFLADGFAGNLSKVIFGLFGRALIASSSAVIN